MQIFTHLPRAFILAAVSALALSGAAVLAPAHTRAEAKEMRPAPSDMARVTLLPGWRTAKGTHMAALRVELAPGWKTYWRAPGDAGIPPQFGWDGAENIADVAFHWPVPEVFDLNGTRTIGFANELVLPIEVTPRDPNAPIHMTGKLVLGVCEDICVPLNVMLNATLPSPGAPDGRIKAALRDQPMGAGEAGVRAARCAVEPIRDGLRVRAQIEMPALGADEVAVIEHPDKEIWVAEAMARREGDVLHAETDMVPPSAEPFALDRSRLLITVLAEGRAVEIAGCTGG